MMFKRALPKGVLLLGVASFFNDIASEIVYPLLPIFLTETVGATAIFIGLLEGMAESLASLTKLFSGFYSDRLRKREPFVLAGYSVANLVRPLISLVVIPWQAFAIRFTDRVAKGVRGAPRDAWLASMASPQSRGWIFGFHRAMDHAGAMFGPLLATLFLVFYPGEYRLLFFLTIIPGVLVVLAVFYATKVSSAEQDVAKDKIQKLGFMDGIRTTPRSFRYYLLVLLFFTLGNSSDAFLLLRLRDVGVRDAWIPGLWALLHLVKMLSSTYGGILSDKIGRKRAIILGWCLYALVYATIGVTSNLWLAIGIFLLYGVYYGLTEGPEKALIADLVEPHVRGTAYGLYNLVLGIGAFPASVLFGFIVQTYSYAHAFVFGAFLAAFAALMMGFLRFKKIAEA